MQSDFRTIGFGSWLALISGDSKDHHGTPVRIEIDVSQVKNEVLLQDWLIAGL